MFDRAPRQSAPAVRGKSPGTAPAPHPSPVRPQSFDIARIPLLPPGDAGVVQMVKGKNAPAAKPSAKPSVPLKNDWSKKKNLHAAAHKLRREAKAGRKKSGQWNEAKAERYKDHLIRRGTRRADKNKPVAALVRKYEKARRAADPAFKHLKLADAPTAGHHVPALALGNARGGTYEWGPRGSAQEKALPRVYFEGNAAQRSNAHGVAHMAETFAGLGPRNTPNFKGNDRQLADTLRRAHTGLIDWQGAPIMASASSQSARSSSQGASTPIELAEATGRVLASRGIKSKTKIAAETTDSEPEQDEKMWHTDSDSD